MELIDSHCHPQFPQYDKDREEMIKRTLDGGVRMICVGTDLEMSRRAIGLAEKYDGIWATVGIHPNDLDRGSKFSILDLQMANHPKVVAIGEVGLDYYRTPEPEKQEKQRQVLEEFIKFALNTHKPLVIHCRDAHNDLIEILGRWITNRGPLNPDSPASLRGVIHSFTGTWQQAQKYFDLGFLIGLNGIITFTHQYDETVINAPLDRILIETDAPYLAPVPYRGKRNEPFYIIEVARKIAELKKISPEEIGKEMAKNAMKLFNLG